MDAQELVTTVGPWIAAAAALLTAATALGRGIGSRRMRANVQATSDLIEGLPTEGTAEARAELVEVLKLHTSRLLHRTQDGLLLTTRQAAGVAAAFIALVSGGLSVLMLYLRDFSSYQDDGWFTLFCSIVLAVLTLSSSMAAVVLLVILLAGLERWLEDRTHSVETARGATVAEQTVVWLLMPIVWIIRRVRTIWAKTRRGKKTQAAP